MNLFTILHELIQAVGIPVMVIQYPRKIPHTLFIVSALVHRSWSKGVSEGDGGSDPKIRDCHVLK